MAARRGESRVRGQKTVVIVQWAVDTLPSLWAMDHRSLDLGRTRLMTLAANPRSLVFFLAYPGPGNLDGASRSLIEGRYLLTALDQVLKDEAFRVIELTSLKAKELRSQVAQALDGSGKRIAFHCEPVQWVNEENLIDPADLSSA